MAKTKLDYEPYYDVRDCDKVVGKCEECGNRIQEYEEHYDIYDELVCVECISDYVYHKFYKN